MGSGNFCFEFFTRPAVSDEGVGCLGRAAIIYWSVPGGRGRLFRYQFEPVVEHVPVWFMRARRESFFKLVRVLAREVFVEQFSGVAKR